MPEIPHLNHGIIGNGSLLALISPSSAIEWLCLPRFDSPSVFARLLDASAGGVFRILFSGEEVPGDRPRRSPSTIASRCGGAVARSSCRPTCP